MVGVAPPGPAMPVTAIARSTRARVARAHGHGAGDLLADRADARQKIRRDAEHLLLGQVVVGHIAALDYAGRAGDLGQAADDQAAGAGFGGRQVPAARLAGGEQLLGQRQALQRKGHGSQDSARRASAPA